MKVFTKGRRAQSAEDYETWNEGGVAPTLNLGDNTGDTRATTLIVFYGNRVDDIRIQGDVINTLQARMGTGGNNMPILVYPIQDGRDMEKKQNGLGVGEENETFTPFGFASGQGAKARSLAITENGTPPLRSQAGGNSIPSVMTSVSTVRRLTPTECERLQGFPDDWTKWDENGKEVTDGHRYKQLGNAVAVPVVSFIVERMVKTLG